MPKNICSLTSYPNFPMIKIVFGEFMGFCYFHHSHYVNYQKLNNNVAVDLLRTKPLIRALNLELILAIEIAVSGFNTILK